MCIRDSFMLTDAELKDLSRRALMSAQRGYKVARGDTYAAALAEETGVALSGSASDLVTACKAALAKRAGKPVEPPKPVPEPEEELPVEVSPPPAPEPEAEEEEGLKENDDEEAPAESEPEADEEVEGYESWTRDELYEEAKAREVEGRSDMNKAELVAALQADDAKEEV